MRNQQHTCDRKGPPAKVIDESGDKPIKPIYATCSVCRKPQVFIARTRIEQLIAMLETLSSEQRELIVGLVELWTSAAQQTLLEDVRTVPTL